MGMKNALTRYAIKNTLKVREGVSAFTRYANNLTRVNRHFQTEQRVPMIVHQNLDCYNPKETMGIRD